MAEYGVHPPQQSTDDPLSAGLEAWLQTSCSREHTGSYDDLKLGPVQRALAALPTPPPAPVTVAGTKGKGSTIRFLESLLLTHSQQVLAFTSPHVFDIHERWRINGIPINAQTVAVATPCCPAPVSAMMRSLPNR